MMKRRLLLRLGVLAAVAVVGFLLIAWWTAPQVNKETFEQIKKGMSEEQVAELLNMPASEPFYWTAEKGSNFVIATYGDGARPGQWKEWASGGHAIVVGFERGEVAWAAHFLYSESLLDKIRRWLHLY